ncbi:ATP-binding protein [Parasedimentitalea psychrophila]
MRIAKFPHRKDFVTFDYSAAAVTQARIDPFCSGPFTQDAHNLILMGGTGTDNAGKIIRKLTPLDCVVIPLMICLQTIAGQ